MRTVLVVFLGFVMLALESPLLYQLRLNFYAPDLALCVIVYLAMTRPLLYGALGAFLLGFFKDGFAGSPMGMYMQILTTAYYLTHYAVERVTIRTWLQLMLLTFCASAVSSTLFFLLSVVFDRNFAHSQLVFKMLIPHALVTAPFAPIVFYLLQRFDKLPATNETRVFFE
ncbi:MAG: rod shape-determining protein MreD [Myxococcales bacterium]|nr:rod shape-determining protein MreD [Myxococcales bacterium]